MAVTWANTYVLLNAYSMVSHFLPKREGFRKCEQVDYSYSQVTRIINARPIAGLSFTRNEANHLIPSECPPGPRWPTCYQKPVTMEYLGVYVYCMVSIGSMPLANALNKFPIVNNRWRAGLSSTRDKINHIWRIFTVAIPATSVYY